MTKPTLPQSGGSYTRDDKGALTQTERTAPAGVQQPVKPPKKER